MPMTAVVWVAPCRIRSQPSQASVSEKTMMVSGVTSSTTRFSARRQRVDEDMQAEMRALPHRDRRADKHQPHETGARDFVVPDERACQHITREHAEQKIDGDNGQEQDADPLQAVIDHFLE